VTIEAQAPEARATATNEVLEMATAVQEIVAPEIAVPATDPEDQVFDRL